MGRSQDLQVNVPKGMANGDVSMGDPCGEGENNSLTQEEWELVQLERRKTGNSIPDILDSLGRRECLKSALELQYGVNYVDLGKCAPQPHLFELLSLTLIRKHQVAPVTVLGKTLILAMVNPNDHETIDIIHGRFEKLRVRSVVCTLTEWEEFVEHGATESNGNP